MNGFFTLTWSNIKSAIVYGVLTAIFVFILVICSAVVQHGSIFGIDWKNVFDQAVIAVIAGVVIPVVSILKNLLTDAQGKFLGKWEVIPDKSSSAKE